MRVIKEENRIDKKSEALKCHVLSHIFIRISEGERKKIHINYIRKIVNKP